MPRWLKIGLKYTLMFFGVLFVCELMIVALAVSHMISNPY